MESREQQQAIPVRQHIVYWIVYLALLLPTTDALALESGFPEAFIKNIVGSEDDWASYHDSLHVGSPDRIRSAFRRCSGDRDKPTCLTFLHIAGKSPIPVLTCTPLRNSNQIPIGFSKYGLLIWEASSSSVYILQEDLGCKKLNIKDVWSPELGPNGLKLAYLTSFMSGGANLFIYHLDTELISQLTSFNTEKTPGNYVRWVSEGEKVALNNDFRKNFFWLQDRVEQLIFEVSDFYGAPPETWRVLPDGSNLLMLAISDYLLTSFEVVRPKIFDNPHQDFKLVPGCNYGSTDCRSKGSTHTGTDSWGAPTIVAVAPGKVVKIQRNDQREICKAKGTAICAGQVKAGGVCSDHGLGNTVILEHKGINGEKIYSQYAHLASIDPNMEISLKFGTCIEQGKAIGTMGSTGYGQAVCWGKPAHLHFEIKSAFELGDPKSQSYFGYITNKKITDPNVLGFRDPSAFIGKVEAFCY